MSMSEKERSQKIVDHLTPKTAKCNEVTSELIESIRIAGEDIKDAEDSQIARAKIYSELAAYFAQMAARELV